MDYSAELLKEYAGRMYVRARTMILRYALLGALIGAAGAFLAGAMNPESNAKQEALLVFTTILGLLIGIEIGRRKSFSLRFDAQRALCWFEIEKNTHELLAYVREESNSTAAAGVQR